MVRLLNSTLWLAFVVLTAASVFAQEAPPTSATPTSINDQLEWEPLGPIPVDQAGSGRRGYVLPGEGTDVTAPGQDQVSLHTVAANTFYREQTKDFLITQRYETHTVALGYRRGFRTAIFPRLELGGQVQFTQSGGGVLNGFIEGFEDLWVSVTGSASAKNNLRTSPGALPLGTVVSQRGRPLYRATGDDSGFGDFYFMANALVRDAAPSSRQTRVAVHLGLNVAGSSAFTQGNFAGIGLSLEKKLAGWAAFHGDVRAHFILDSESVWGLPLKRTSLGFSVGPELKLTRNTAVSLQIDGSTTPYLPTGVAALDDDYGDVTLGLSHRFKAGRRHLLAQIYARENMILPFQVRWSADPDFALGIKATIR